MHLTILLYHQPTHLFISPSPNYRLHKDYWLLCDQFGYLLVNQRVAIKWGMVHVKQQVDWQIAIGHYIADSVSIIVTWE